MRASLRNEIYSGEYDSENGHGSDELSGTLGNAHDTIEAGV